MASRNPHSGDPRPGPSWASGAKTSAEPERRLPPPGARAVAAGQSLWRPDYGSVRAESEASRLQREEGFARCFKTLNQGATAEEEQKQLDYDDLLDSALFPELESEVALDAVMREVDAMVGRTVDDVICLDDDDDNWDQVMVSLSTKPAEVVQRRKEVKKEEEGRKEKRLSSDAKEEERGRRGEKRRATDAIDEVKRKEKRLSSEATEERKKMEKRLSTEGRNGEKKREKRVSTETNEERKKHEKRRSSEGKEEERKKKEKRLSSACAQPGKNMKALGPPNPLEATVSGHVRLYKVVYDRELGNTLNTKDFVRRLNGKCPDKYKQFNYPQPPADPRLKFRRTDPPKNLRVPNFTVDDNYTGIPPQREVAIFNLNDNVNRDFLMKMARNQKLEPQDVTVFVHPSTKKHLGIALILFLKSKDARAFVEQNNEVKVMGLSIGCRLDPFAAELNAKYVELVQSPLPALPHLSGMSDHELSLRREKIVGNRVAKTPPVEAAPPDVVVIDDVPPRNRSLSPMDTSNSPIYVPPPVPQAKTPPFEPAHPPPMTQACFDDAGASTSKMPSPPPPYSELPPANHGIYQEERRSESSRRTVDPEGKPRREKRRRASTSSSSSYSSTEEGHRHRSEGGVKKKREEYLKVKRYVSSERDSNGDKRLKEVQTVTYKRRTEQRTIIPQKHVSPDSFDEEMQRRERSMSRNKRTAEKRGRDEMRWSSPSSDSDNGGRRKRGKDRATENHSREDERRQPQPGDATPCTPSTQPSCFTPSLSTTSTPSSRRRGFDSAPIFDPSQPPPVMVPPVGVVQLDCALPPPPPIPLLPPMMVPPPPLPGGFIPPPEFFGLKSTPEMMCAASAAAAAGLAPPPLGMPPPPLMSVPMFGATTPRPTFASPVKMPLAPQLVDPAAGAAAASRSLPAVFSSPPPSTTMRATGSTSMTTTARTEMKGMTPSSGEGGTTPKTGATSGSPEKKVNLDDRLTQLFGLSVKKSKKDEETSQMKQVASASSISALGSADQRQRDDDDMEIDEDDDMDVASSSSGDARGTPVMDERGEGRETEEDKKRREEQEKAKKEEQVAQLTKITLERLVKDMQLQVTRDLQRKLEATAYQTLEAFEKKQKNEEEERRKQMIRESMVTIAARDASAAVPKRDPMEELLAAKLKSPEALMSGISKVFSTFSIVKKKITAPAFSRDGTPASRGDSRAQSPAKSRSASPSASSSSNEPKRRRRSSRTSDSSADSDEEEMEPRKAMKRRPNMRNIESSQESSAASTGESSDSEFEREKENQGMHDSSMPDCDVDVEGMSEDEADRIKKGIEEEQSASSLEAVAGPSTSAAAAAAAAAAPFVAADQVPFGPSSVQQPVSVRTINRNAANINAAARGGGWSAAAAGAAAVAGGTAGSAAAAAGGRAPSTPSLPAVAAAAAAAVAPSVQPRPPIKTKKDVQRRVDEDRVSNEILSLLPPPVPRKTTKADVPEKRERKKRVVFTKRSEEEENRIRDSFRAGMDAEDEAYLQHQLAEMQKDGARPFGIDREIEFESRIRAFTPLELPTPAKVGKVDLYYDDEDLTGIVPHPAGCARAQGFYRLTFKQKIRIMRRPEAFQDRTEINERDEVVTRHQVQAQKEQRSMNRRLQTMMDSNPNSEYFKVNQLKYRKKMIKFARSRIHGWGLYALEPIAPDDMIVEYIGQKIRPIIADEREKQYERRGIGSSYLFRIDEDEVIDATRQGNFARFINHSCQPNCYAKVVTVDGDKRIVIYSKSLIQKGDEITYDYKFPIEDEKIDCLCGAPLCRGTLN